MGLPVNVGFQNRIRSLGFRRMNEFDSPNHHILSSAVGWLELGNPAEAALELSHLPREVWEHPDVLEVRWLMHAQDNQWTLGLEVAQLLVENSPGRASGWLHRAYALRRVPGGGLEKAWDALLPAAALFPQDAIIPYNLSCYACQMLRLDDARDWLRRSIESGSKGSIRQMALRDDDLEVLWPEIQGW